MDAEPEGQIAENDGAAHEAGAETLIDLLTGAAIRSTPKNRPVQKVLRQLIETYGFDRSTIHTGYRPTARGKRAASVDIVIFRDGQEPADEAVERVIVCQPQKPREKLRSPQEAAADLRKLQDKLELLPGCHMGMWTNGHGEFFVPLRSGRGDPVRDPIHRYRGVAGAARRGADRQFAGGGRRGPGWRRPGGPKSSARASSAVSDQKPVARTGCVHTGALLL